MSHTSQTFDGQDPEATSHPILERRIDLTSISWYSVAWILVFLIAALPRLIGWSNWPLSASEAQLANDALAIVQGGAISDQAMFAPLATGLTAVALFLFGATDNAARVVPLLLGFASIGMILLLRRWIGRGTSLGAALIVAISPTLVAASREVGTASMFIAAMLLVLWLGLRFLGSPGNGNGLLLGIALATLILSDPLGWIATPLMVAVAYRLGHSPRRHARDILTVVLGFLATLVVISTFIFTKLEGLTRFLGESLTQLWDVRISPIGELWYLTPFQLIVDDTLVVTLAIGTLLTTLLRKRERVTLLESRSRFVLAEWAGLGLALGVVLGGKDLTLFAFTVLPLAVLAGNGLHRLVSAIDPWVITRRDGVLFALALILVLFSAGSLAGLLLGNTDDSLLDWLFKFLVVGMLVLAPGITALLWLRPRMSGSAGPIVMLLGVMIIAGLALRTAVMLSDTSIDRPGEILNVGNTTPAVGQVVDRVNRLSRDVTTFEQDIRDPEGGHGLKILVDATIDQPFRWYFRDYPFLTVFTPAEANPALSNPDVIIIGMGDSRAAAVENDNYVGRTYALQTTLPASFTDPSWSSVLRSLVDPEEIRDFMRFLVDREVVAPHPPDEFRLLLTNDRATRVYGPSVP